MSDPFFDELERQLAKPAQTEVDAAKQYLADRKRMRESRMRWIEENEMPTAYSPTTENADGSVSTYQGPFQIGIIKPAPGESYPQDGPIKPKPVTDTEDLLTGVDDVFRNQALAQQQGQSSMHIVQDVNESNIFRLGEESSPHPAMKEGEDPGEYAARVSDYYQKIAGSADDRRNATPADRIWRDRHADDTAGVRPALRTSAGASEFITGHDLGNDANPLLADQGRIASESTADSGTSSGSGLAVSGNGGETPRASRIRSFTRWCLSAMHRLRANCKG